MLMLDLNWQRTTYLYILFVRRSMPCLQRYSLNSGFHHAHWLEHHQLVLRTTTIEPIPSGLVDGYVDLVGLRVLSRTSLTSACIQHRILRDMRMATFGTRCGTANSEWKVETGTHGFNRRPTLGSRMHSFLERYGLLCMFYVCICE